MKTKFWLLIVLVLLLSACSAPVPADLTKSDNTAAKSDGNNYYDPNLYTLTVQIGGEIKEHTEVHAQGSSYNYNGIGGGSFSVWQDGKGMVPVKIISMEPVSPVVSVGDTIILKTEDLKFAALQPGWTTQVKCRMDYEPLTKLNVPYEVVDAELTQTWELDLCRMVTPKFTEPLPVEE